MNNFNYLSDLEVRYFKETEFCMSPRILEEGIDDTLLIGNSNCHLNIDNADQLHFEEWFSWN